MHFEKFQKYYSVGFRNQKFVWWGRRTQKVANRANGI
jgi:hypothetical protein